MNKHVHATLVLAMGLGLAACGGGGDGGGATVTAKALVPLTTANYQAIADSSTSSVANSDAILDAADAFAPASVASASVVPAALPASGGLANLTRLALSRLTTGSAGRATAAAVETAIEACGISGTLRVDVDDADNNRVSSAGDGVTVTANNCVAAAGEAAINGAFTVRLRSVSLNRQNELSSGVLEISYSSFGSNELVLDGAAVLSVSADQLVLDFNGLSARAGAMSWVYDYVLTANAGARTVSAAGPITVNGSTYVLATPAPIQFSAAQPDAGTLRVSDGHGNRVDVQMGSTSYTASLYLAGDEVADASVVRAW